MKTMRIIDILVNIANRKEVPKKIKYQGSIFTYNKEVKDYETWFEDNSGLTLFNLVYVTPFLNDEVEIIEDTPKENKKLDKIDLNEIIQNREAGVSNDTYLACFINSIIDKINGEE